MNEIKVFVGRERRNIKEGQPDVYAMWRLREISPISIKDTLGYQFPKSLLEDHTMPSLSASTLVDKTRYLSSFSPAAKSFPGPSLSRRSRPDRLTGNPTEPAFRLAVGRFGAGLFTLLLLLLVRSLLDRVRPCDGGADDSPSFCAWSGGTPCCCCCSCSCSCSCSNCIEVRSKVGSCGRTPKDED